MDEEPVRSQLVKLLPEANLGSISSLATSARHQVFRKRQVLVQVGAQIDLSLVLDGYVIARRLAETGQVYGALIAGPGYFAVPRSISDPADDSPYQLVALTSGSLATWDPQSVRTLALGDPGLAVNLLDRSWDFTLTLTARLDERTLENARQRLAAILTRYGKPVFDTPHPAAQRADLAAMIGTSEVMMYRALRELEAEGLILRESTGGIRIVDEERLQTLIAVAPPGGAPAR